MLCGIGETFRRLKDSGRKIILFELVYKLGATAIVYPLLILMLEGLLAGCGGFLFCLNSCAGFVEQAKGLEMDAISASVIGGTLLSGGVGTPFGTIFGVLIKGTITSLITTQGTLSSWWVRIVLSALLCFFIVLQAIFARMKKKNA